MARPKSDWELEYRRRQEDINRWVSRHYGPRLVEVQKIRVYPPGEYQRYLRRSPCADCEGCEACNVPCQAYLQWYNKRMEAARIRGGIALTSPVT